MWVSSFSPPNLSLIGPLTTEIYYQTGIPGNTDKQTESDTLPLQDTGSSKKDNLYKADIYFIGFKSDFKATCG